MKVRQRTDGRKLTIKRAASANFAPKQEKPALMTSHKTQKEQEFPYIEWSYLDSPTTKEAVLLYNERVTTYKEMSLLQQRLSEDPNLADQICKLDARNRLADRKLQELNNQLKLTTEKQ